jgi:arylsulfatase A-like enzyme
MPAKAQQINDTPGPPEATQSINGQVVPAPSTFALDRIATNGLRYTNFHSTSLCSPTRTALNTNRNHHSLRFGVVTEHRRVSSATTASLAG